MLTVPAVAAPPPSPSALPPPAPRSWKVTDESLAALGALTSLLCLNVLGCHRLTPGGKARVAHLLDSAHAF